MAKDEKNTINITWEDFQKFLETQNQQQLEAIKELKIPYVDPKVTAAREAQKEQFRLSEAQAQAHKKWKEDNCTHIRPEDKKSLFWQFRNVYPKGAITLACCRCNKKIQNYDPEAGTLIQNPEFDHWILQPNGLFQG